MAELAEAEVYTPRTLQIWKALINWLAFFFQIVLQIVRVTPSVTQLLSYLRRRHYSLISPSLPPSATATAFKSLPVIELPDSREPELSPPPPPPLPQTAAVEINEDGVSDYSTDRLLKKLTVVLDLDETLVCAYETSSLPAAVCSQAIEAGLKWFELECISSDKECDGKPKISYVTVFERPGLQEFLKQLDEFADLLLFTAGLEGYARPLVDRIDPENRFSVRLYRPSTVTTKYCEHVKDLSCISKDLCRVVIVDNNQFSFFRQPLNGIPCVPFSAGRPHDDQLLDVILPLLKHLALEKDVRPMLYERFHMPEWFQSHGIPASGWTH